MCVVAQHKLCASFKLVIHVVDANPKKLVSNGKWDRKD